MTSEKITSQFITELLRQPSTEAQAAVLQAADLFNAEGLDELLDFAGDQVGNDPGQARQLTILCVNMATDANAQSIIPPAMYLRAQTYAIDGEFSQAGDLIRAAREQYLSLGETVAALRTNVGLINVLAEEGQYQEAIRVGLSTLETIERTDQADITPVDARRLSALIRKNLGICFELIGDYDQALHMFSVAETLFQEAGMDEEGGALAMSRGSILLNVGRVVESLSALERAAAVFDSMDNKLRRARCLNNLGNVHLLLGNYSQSLEVLSESRRLLSALDARADQLILSGLTADVYLALNLYPEAIAEYQAGNDGLKKTGMEYQRAWVLWGLGAALTTQFQWEAAEAVLSEAAALFQEAGNKQLLSGVMLEQAQVLNSRGQRGAAVEKSRQALQMVMNDDWPVQRVYALLRLADLVLPDVSLAESLLLEVQQIASGLALPHLRFRVHQRIGHLFLLQGRDREAELMMDSAIGIIEQLRTNLPQEAIRVSFLRDKIAAYEDLAQVYLARGDQESLQKALRVTEQAKSRTLAELIMGLVETRLAMDSNPEEVQRLQTLRAELNAIYNQALRGAQDGERGVPWTDLHERSISLANEIGRLQLELSDNKTPALAAPALPFERILEQISPDQTVLSYHILAEEVLVFVFQHGQLCVRRQIANVSEVQKLLDELEIEWARFQAGTSFISHHLKRLELSVREVLGNLYDLLVAPIEAFLPTSGVIIPRLGIIQHGLLHEVPFQALFDGQQYLIDRYELVYAPSLTLLAHYQQPKALRNEQAFVIAVSDPLIPNVIVEAQAVARCLAHTGIYLNEQATLATFQAQAANCGILHLACHGLFRADNPMFSALKLHDGWLTAADVLALDLTDTFVVLSACESGRNDGRRGDEILGLTRAFLGAGARTLCVSLWLVEDEASASLMSCLYAQIAQGADYSRALRKAQLELKEKQPHPYYWAPFILIGQMAAGS